ncbi:MAG: HDIG domain-containing protein [Exiguobacterium sp.]|uniref:HD family phosphohydrolase n=1 Tax=Exiguobacterium TaxID=33986 RepID=UPI0004A8AE65|nr:MULTISPECIES: HDIG domain-containing metalloprotein [unclassified Exiguobacterium]KDN57285.1 phosphohydrolase [Exiguobacterium sp. AB2]MDX5324176.1 HDIG domain-containing protein [Exiguobacterium sp.]MDX5426001.1 HDIG domain-containing protein [Exiguobacterium sp.]MDX6773395.1 HDIG domain-containing protein [Exiguobacterium sp.]
MQRARHWTVAAISIVFFLILGAILYFTVRPTIISVEPLGIAEQDIRSPITIEDRVATERLRQEATNAVGSQFSLRREFADQQIAKVEQLFAAFENTDDETELADIKSRLNSTDANGFLGDDELNALLQASENTRRTVEDVTVTALQEVMGNRIETSSDSIADARDRAGTLIDQSPLSLEFRTIAKSLSDQLIVPNYVFDSEATRQKEQEAVDAVDPVIIQEGQLLVNQGEVVTREIYRKLELSGAIDPNRSFAPLFGSYLLSGLLTAGFLFMLIRSKINELLLRPKILITVYGLLLFQLGLFFGVGYIGIEFTTYAYVLAPTAFVVLLLRILVDERVALASALITMIAGAIVVSYGQNTSFMTLVYFATGSFLAVFLVEPKIQRKRLFLSGILLGIINIIMVLALLFLRNTQVTWEMAAYLSGFAVVGALLSIVLTFGFLPFLEPWFGVLSSGRLVELMSPTHPLLRKLLMEAPGTYHHSMMVANLAESACEAIGADGLLARVASYYHDLGKTERPLHFIENQQNGVNPHDRLTPEESADIIMAHPYDGADLLRRYKLPQEIIDIAEQHHGTSLLKFFYVKAKETRDVSESRFRYPGPKPQTREAAVVMIVDSIEAAVRSQKQPTPDRIRQLVNGIIRDKLQDGQFEDCDLTTKEVWRVGESACETLTGLFHERIEYPELKKEGDMHANHLER